jgi:hypothetical protein
MDLGSPSPHHKKKGLKQVREEEWFQSTLLLHDGYEDMIKWAQTPTNDLIQINFMDDLRLVR